MNKQIVLAAVAIANLLNSTAEAKPPLVQGDDRQLVSSARVYDKQGRIQTYEDVVPFWVYTAVLSEISPEDRALATTHPKRDSIATSSATTPTDLKSCSIKMDAINKKVFVEQVPASICIVASEQDKTPPPIAHWYMVKRPDSEPFSAVIGIVESAPAILNPSQYFVYGQLPHLKDLSIEQADELWGKGNRKDCQERQSMSYRLISKNQYNLKKEFFLDLIFNHNRIEKYQIRDAAKPTLFTGWREPGADSNEGRREW